MDNPPGDGHSRGNRRRHGCSIIIDTDPGQDDAVAILLALASPEIEVLGLTCVPGQRAAGADGEERADHLRTGGTARSAGLCRVRPAAESAIW
ncbi:MAG: nucleoside hydrolase [Defluviimonas denitrificans]